MLTAKQILSLCLLWFVVARETALAGSGGTIVVSFVSYFDAVRTESFGACCTGGYSDVCRHSCDNVLSVCLSSSPSQPGNCLANYENDPSDPFRTVGSSSVDAIVQKHVFDITEFREKKLSFSGPLANGATLMINVSNVNIPRQKTPIATFSYPFPEHTSSIERGAWSYIGLSFPQYSNTYATHWIVFKWKIVCNENYYGKCGDFCSPEDNDTNGHYTCDPMTGQKVCCDGYEDPENNCKKPVDYCVSNPCTNGQECSLAQGNSPCDSVTCRQQCKTRPSFKCTDSNGYRARGSILVAVLISVAALLVAQ